MIEIRYINRGKPTGQPRCVCVAETTEPSRQVADFGSCRTFYWYKTDPFEDFDYTVTKAKRWAEREKIGAVYIVRGGEGADLTP